MTSGTSPGWVRPPCRWSWSTTRRRSPTDPAAQQVVAAVTARLRADPRVSTVVPPTAGMSLSQDGRTGIVTAGAAGDPNAMVRAADALAKPLAGLSRPGISVTLTGDSALWANFNSANHSAPCCARRCCRGRSR